MRNLNFAGCGSRVNWCDAFLKVLCRGVLGGLLLASASQVRGGELRDTLQIYFVDVEGGQATLFVTPRGQATMDAMPTALWQRPSRLESARLILCCSPIFMRTMRVVSRSWRRGFRLER